MLQHEKAASPVSRAAVPDLPGGCHQMSDKRTFILAHSEARRLAGACVSTAPDGYVVTVAPPTRNGEQNAKFHAICSDLANSGVKWAGERRTAAQWKVLLVSGHAAVTKDEPAQIVPGIEGEFVNIRESTALMSKARGSSLIEYALAFCAQHEVSAPGRLTPNN